MNCFSEHVPFNRDSILSLVPHEARSSVEYELTKEQVEEIRFRPGRKLNSLRGEAGSCWTISYLVLTMRCM